MPVIAERKLLELISFETIIKRCPVCLKDTRQQAYYAQKPDMSVGAETPTEPSEHIIILPKLEHEFEWYVLATCETCDQTYRVMGIPRLKMDSIPKRFQQKDVSLIQLCCDICYNEYYEYTIGEIFINLSSGGKVYLCEKHAEEIDEEKRKTNSYDFLIKRMTSWNSKERGLMIKLENQKIIIKQNSGYTKALLKLFLNHDMLSENEIMKKESLDKSWAIRALNYLISINLLNEKVEGTIFKKRNIYITDLGKSVLNQIK